MVLNIPGSKDLIKKIGDIGTGPYDAYFKPGKAVESTDNHLLEFYQHSHVENPEYNISHRDSHSYAKGICMYVQFYAYVCAYLNVYRYSSILIFTYIYVQVPYFYP